MDDQNIERIAVLGLGRRNEAPVIGIGETGHQRLRQREHFQVRIEVQFAGASARRFDDGMNVLVVGPGRKLEQVRHGHASLAAPTVSAIRAPRAPSGFGAPVVVSRAVWCWVQILGAGD